MTYAVDHRLGCRIDRDRVKTLAASIRKTLHG